MGRKNHYRRNRRRSPKRPTRWFWGKHRRIGNHLYRQRILKRRHGRSWRVIRKYWHLVRKNHYKKRRARRTRRTRRNRRGMKARWFWGKYRKIGRHLYRRRILKKYSHRRWKHVR